MNTPEVQEALKHALSELEKLSTEQFHELLTVYEDIHSPEFLRQT